MDDSKLLELASLAAGEKYTREHNPLERDDLALRLAVKIGITFRHFGHKVSAIGTTQCDEYVVGDPCDATRRAIVRTAAEIGKK